MRKSLIALTCCLVVAAICLAEMKRIKLKNGAVVVGEIVEKTKDGIKVKDAIAERFYPNSDIESIEDVRAEAGGSYASRFAAIDKKDADGYVALGQWAMDRKMYGEAIQCFEAALAARKDMERAVLLLRQAKARLEQSGGKVETPPQPETPGEGRTAGDKGEFLSEQDIYRIRVCELGENETVGVDFRGDAVEKFIKQMRGVGDFREQGFAVKFRSVPRPRQARYILANTDRSDPLRDDILVKGDPASMREFRGPIWRWISASCASIKCHGSAQGKEGLKLYNLPGSRDAVDYTNFLILDSHSTKKGGLRVIRRDEPEKSLLLAFALPKNLAEYRHPESMKPPFPSREAAGYQVTLKWLKSLAGPLHPDYRIKQLPPYVMAPSEGPPGLPPATAPATQPDKKTETPF